MNNFIENVLSRYERWRALCGVPGTPLRIQYNYESYMHIHKGLKTAFLDQKRVRRT